VPGTIGVMLIALVSSLIIVLVGSFFPALFKESAQFTRSLDFATVLMKIMLSFLLFAGSIHINMENIRTERTTIITFSTVGILISTFLIGGMVFLFCKAFQLEVGFIYCLGP